jgi:hypothetical protein
MILRIEKETYETACGIRPRTGRNALVEFG